MDVIRQWAFSACAALVACAIAGAVVPKGSLSKVFSVTVSVFFLCCLLSPFIISNPGLAVDIREHSMVDIERRADMLTGIAAAQSQEAAALGVKKIIAQKLEKMGINYTDIAINISTNIPYVTAAEENTGQSSFDIDGADITLLKEHEESHDAIRGELEESLGFKVRLGYV